MSTPTQDRAGRLHGEWRAVWAGLRLPATWGPPSGATQPGSSSCLGNHLSSPPLGSQPALIPDGLLHVPQGPLGLLKLVAGLLGSWGAERGKVRSGAPAQSRKTGGGGALDTPAAPPPGLLWGRRHQEGPAGLPSCRAHPPPRLVVPKGSGPGLLGRQWLPAHEGGTVSSTW